MNFKDFTDGDWVALSNPNIIHNARRVLSDGTHMRLYDKNGDFSGFATNNMNAMDTLRKYEKIPAPRIRLISELTWEFQVPKNGQRYIDTDNLVKMMGNNTILKPSPEQGYNDNRRYILKSPNNLE